MRALVMILVAVISLAILRSIVRDITRAVSRAMKGSERKSAEAAQSGATESVGKLVKDPQTGTYIDPAIAVSAEVAGKTYFFESKETRDEYLKSRG